MIKLRALIGEALIHWGFNLAEPAWDNDTLIAFAQFIDVLRQDTTYAGPK